LHRLATAYSSYDYAAIAQASSLVVDTRNATRKLVAERPELRAKIVLS